MKIGKIIKRVFCIFLAALFAFIMVRIFMLDDNRTLKYIYPTQNAVDAFKAQGDKAFTYHSVADKICNDGYFMAYGMVFSPLNGEMQLTVKYNDSLTEHYLPGADPDSFVWELADADGNTLSVGKVLDTAEKYQYNYIRLAFENVLPDDNTEINLRFICDDADYPPKDTFPHLTVHRPEMKMKKYGLSADEKTSLSK